MRDLTMISYMLASIGVGAMLSAQAPMNAILARALDSALGATLISIGVAFVSVMFAVLILGAGNMTRETLETVPWWVFLAGIVGTVFVGAGAFVVPATGALLFFVCVVTGQLLGALLMDHFGAFELTVRAISLQRVAGLVLVLFGAILVARG